MFSSYFDVIIMRSPIARLAESCAYLMNDPERSGNRSVPMSTPARGPTSIRPSDFGCCTLQ